MKLRPSVRMFAQEMERRLREHDPNRGCRGWKNEEFPYLIARLLGEVGELAAVLISERTCGSNAEERKPVRVRHEAADVGNFAMMIYDICERDGVD